jgi:hypothetical protein
VVHFWFGFGGFFVCFCLCLALCGLIGIELLWKMFWVLFSLCLYSLLCSWLVSSLLYKNLIAAYLCCGGWFDVHGMMVSVKVSFL